MTTDQLPALIEFDPKEIANFPVADEAIAELAERYMPLTINGIDDKEGFAEVHAARMDMVRTRVAVENRRLEVGRLFTGGKKIVDDEAKRLIADMKQIEDHLQAEEDAVKEEKARIKAEEEAKRQAVIDARFDALTEVEAMVNPSAVAAMSDADFAELLAEKTEAHRQKKEQEAKEAAEHKAREEEEAAARAAEEKRLAEERAKLEAERKEQAAVLAAERKALEDKQRIIDEDRRRLAAEQADRERKAELEKAKAEAAERARLAEIERQKQEAEANARAETEEKARREREAQLRPDRQKIAAFADALDELFLPKLQDADLEKAAVQSIERCLCELRELAGGSEDDNPRKET